ncbi:DDE-type integrase/transposase/recombinase [Pollutimonas bauzanensis]|nr:DDE-type integrase/transposase/recombinase [Pollutimonas bauzanensis]
MSKIPIEFEKVGNITPTEGLVLRVGNQQPKYLRVTHVFTSCIYGIWVTTPQQARSARRPKRISSNEVTHLIENNGGQWGKLRLPYQFIGIGKFRKNDHTEAIEAAWNLIEPLVYAFKNEENLSSAHFTSLIRNRSETLGVNFLTLYRLVLRYYYFGGTRLALISLPPGAKPAARAYSLGEKNESPSTQPSMRRGRQPALASELGRNNFIIDDDDISDMLACLKGSLRKGPAFFTEVHQEYLSTYFRRRHPDTFSQYIDNRYPEPITLRQFRYYVNENLQLTDDLARNLRKYERNPGRTGSVRAAGPGEVYEIDATGGRIFLVTDEENPVTVGKPIIYLIIDRWSRFVVSVYLSLRPPSWSEVQYALLIAFTSRTKRFASMGVDIDDERWPIGRFPSTLCPDRGSDFMSRSMEKVVTDDLRIELTPLPPLCPDGKAIVERTIREIKRRMFMSKLKGTYADRPLDPPTKREAKKAQATAVNSLADAYRAVIEIIDDHNNRPHSALRRRRTLARAGVPPTPKEAYLWGLKNITGLRTPPLADGDYRRLLLGIDDASIAKGVIRYCSRLYYPVNEPAQELAFRSAARPKRVEVRIDRTDPSELFIETSAPEWAHFSLGVGGAGELMSLTLDEEAALADQTALAFARADHESKIQRIRKKVADVAKTPKKNLNAMPTVNRDKLSQIDLSLARQHETTKMKEALSGKSAARDHVPATSEPTWEALEEQERLQNLEIIRKNRGRE